MHLPVALLGVCTPNELKDWPIDAWVVLDCTDEERLRRLAGHVEPGVTKLIPPGRRAVAHPGAPETGGGADRAFRDPTPLQRRNHPRRVHFRLSDPGRQRLGDLGGHGGDITEHARLEAGRRSLEHQLRQTERLESLGKLAGGVAHEFNNLLAVIMNSAFAAQKTSDNPTVQADIEQIQAAAERAARITKQLLIVGRREITKPEPLGLNAVVADNRDLLSSAIGASIEIRVEPAADRHTIDRPRPGRASTAQPGRQRPRRHAPGRHPDEARRPR